MSSHSGYSRAEHEAAEAKSARDAQVNSVSRSRRMSPVMMVSSHSFRFHEVLLRDYGISASWPCQ